MSELRKDPIVDRWVIISSNRKKRPFPKIIGNPEFDNEQACPFCPGNESYAPNEIFVISQAPRAKDTPGWDVRVIPNKYPALKVEGELNKRGIGIFDIMNGIGAHEVIIETPEHKQNISDMSVEQVKKILTAYKERILDLKKDTRFKYILIFKNYGFEAGATLSHSHSQLIALPIIPKTVKEEINGSKKYYEFRERCVYCDIISQELYSQLRIILEEKNFVVLSPFAPRFAFETWILPKKHQSHFYNINNDELESLANVLIELLKKLNVALNDPPYNLVIHTSDLVNGNLEHYHWHIEIIPKLSYVAGFECGSDFFINPTQPEEAVSYLKNLTI